MQNKKHALIDAPDASRMAGDRPHAAAADGAIHGFVVTGAGAGLALIRAFLIEPKLAAGTLVEPVAHRLKSRSVYSRGHGKGPVSPALWRFRDWLIGHIA